MKTVLLLVAALTITESCVPKYSSDPPNCVCGQPLSRRRIVGGVPAEENQYPWQVALLRSQDPSSFFCGGSLLSSDTVLTAAHCVVNKFSVYVAFPQGDVTLQTAKMIKASEILPHPYYTSFPTNNDFAIIKLSSPVQFDDSTQPICLPNPTEDYDDSLAEVTGWGRTGPFSGLSQDLLTINVTTISNIQCQNLVENLTGTNYKISSNEICALFPGKSPCYGDSGGPLITLNLAGSYYSQIGVVSHGLPSYEFACSGPGVYGRVTKQLYWIIKQITGDVCAYPST